MIIGILALLLGIGNLFFYIKLKKQTNNKILNNDKNIIKNKHKMDSISEWIDYYKKTGEKKIDNIMNVLNKKFNKNA